jgi:hypothetical protein
MNLLDNAQAEALTADERAAAKKEEPFRVAEQISARVSLAILQTLLRAEALEAGTNEISYEDLLNDADAVGTMASRALKDVLAPLKPSQPEPKQPETYKIGQSIPGKGIFFGVWQPIHPSGRKSEKQFYVFAAPEDLQDADGKRALLTFNDAAQEVAKLRNWHGHDGIYLTDEKALYTALEGGFYEGQWFIPPVPLVSGRTTGENHHEDNNIIFKDCLYNSKEKGAFSGTICTTDEPRGERFYWTCSEEKSRDGLGYGILMTENWSYLFRRGSSSYSIRPCRVELVPQQQCKP